MLCFQRLSVEVELVVALFFLVLFFFSCWIQDNEGCLAWRVSCFNSKVVVVVDAALSL